MKTSYILGKNIRDAVLSAKHSVTESLRNVKESAQDLVAGLKGQAPSSEVVETKVEDIKFEMLDAFENPIQSEKNKLLGISFQILFELITIGAAFYLHPAIGIMYLAFILLVYKKYLDTSSYLATLNQNIQPTS